MSDTGKSPDKNSEKSPAKTPAAPKENQPGGGPVNIGDNVYMDPVYYYSRERRLSRASPAVRALNDGKSARASFSGGVFGTKSNVVVFITILLLCAMLGLVARFTAREKGVTLGGNILALIIQKEEEGLTLGMIKNAPENGEFYTGAVDIAVSPVMTKPKEGEVAEIPPVFTHRIFFNARESETYLISLPFTESEFFVLLKTGDEQKTLRVRTVDGEKSKK